MDKPKYKILAEKLSFRRYFFVEIVSFNLLGFDMSSRERSLKYPWFIFLLCFSQFTTLSCMIDFAFKRLSEFNLTIDSLVFAVQWALALVKLMTIIMQKKRIADLLYAIWEVEEEASLNDLEIIAAENKSHWRISSIYFGDTLVTGILAGLVPIIFGTVKYILTNEFPHRTPILATNPLDVNNVFNYILVYIWNMFAVHFTVFCSTGVDSLYSWCVHNIVAQFKILQQNIEKLLIENRNETNLEENPNIYKSIKNVIEYHLKTIKLAEQLQRTFRPIAFCEFFFSTAELCFIVYQIGRGTDLSKMPFLINGIFTILIQLLIYSHGGQRLEDESEMVALKVYKSLNWNSWPPKARKMLMLSMLRAQHPCRMTAIFFFVNMRLFLWVLQRAASFLTLLWSVVRN